MPTTKILKASGYSHQGVNSLAHCESLLNVSSMTSHPAEKLAPSPPRSYPLGTNMSKRYRKGIWATVCVKIKGIVIVQPSHERLDELRH
jgi:hypothetical protein